MNRITKSLKQKIDAMHEGDWANGAWGGACSAPYKIRRYFSPNATARIVAEMKRVEKYWRNKVRKAGITKTEPEDGYDWLPEIKPGSWNDSSVPGNEECKLCLTGLRAGGYELALYMWTIDEYHNGPKAGCVKVKKADPEDDGTRIWIAPAEKGPDSRLSWPVLTFGGGFNVELDHFVRWDPERKQFFCLYTAEVETEPISDYLKNENWEREPKRIEFFEKVDDLQKQLLVHGIEFTSIGDGDETWPYVSCLWPTEIELPA